LYRDISIKTTSSMSSLAHAVRQSELSGSAIEANARSLFIDSSVMATVHTDPCYGSHYNGGYSYQQQYHMTNVQCNAVDMTSNLITVFMGFSQLQSLTIHGRIALAVLPMAACTCCSSLQSLSLYIKDSSTMESLGYVQVFPQLRHFDLSIEVDTADVVNVSSVTSFKPWKMLYLRKLMIKSSTVWSASLAGLLRKCKFPALEAIDLSLPTNTPSSVSPHLVKFCRGLPHHGRL
jgi:hypothetical protein